MKKLFAFFLFVLITTVGLFIKVQKAEVLAQAQNGIQCTGQALAQYMNAVISGAGELPRIRLLSPAFNLTNPQEAAIFDAMASSGARFNDLDGFAGNTYSAITGDPQARGAYIWYEQNFKSRFSNFSAGNTVIFTEFGDFRTGTTSMDNRSGLISQMRNEFITTTNDPNIKGITYFSVLDINKYGGNSDFTFHNLSDAEIRSVVGGGKSKIAGANSAQYVDGSGGFPPKAASTGGNMGWTLEILNGPDLAGTSNAVNTARNLGFIPILRVCVGNSCAFSNPSDLVSFLNSLNGLISGEVWVIAGPNEPATETWAATNCGLEVPGQFQLNRISCNETQNPEFHSLRPYPTNPCDPSVSETLFMCSNDLIIKEVFEVTPDDANGMDQNGDGTIDTGPCEPPNADGSQRCYYFISSTSRLNINLDNTYLPIMGNTELVPNAVKRTDSLAFPQRMNEYASWYLNGIIQRAEEQFFTIPQNVYEIINLSGPLRKLLPRNVQTQARIEEKGEGAAGQVRHDQIVACTQGDPVACYSLPATINRMTDVPNNPNDERFSYIPYSSTEDRVGNGRTNPRPVQPGLNDEGGPIVLSQVTYNPAPNSDTDLLYFAHMQEVSELGEMLQQTYAPQGQPLTGSASDGQRLDLLTIPYCEIADSRTNPGDDLYGELVLPGTPAEQQILGGSVSYNVSFYCDFPPTVPNPDCLLNCQSNLPVGTDCNGMCTEERTCQRQSLVDFAVWTNTPKAEEVWDRLVDGAMSVFRRIFPLVSQLSPVDQIKSIPARSEARYNSSNQGASITPIATETLAGNPRRSRSGQEAQIFFPHIGSVHEYFLHDIQKALRPFGFAESSPVQTGTTPAPPGTVGSCQLGTNYCSVESLLPYFENNTTKATNASQICQAESRSNPFALNNSCLWTSDGIDNDGDGAIDLADSNYDGATGDFSVGLFQINLLISSRCPVDPIATYTLNPPTCSFQNMQALEDCVEYFQDPINSIQWTYNNSASGTNWNKWSTARGCGLSTN